MIIKKNTVMKEEDIDYITQHYRTGLFSTEKGWLRLNIASVSRWKRIRIAAVIAFGIALSAAASVIIYNASKSSDYPETKKIATQDPKNIVKVIDFETTPLTTVIKKIKEIYGVEVTNLPENAEEICLSLHYEGTATDLVATINEILDTNMEVKE